MKKVRGEVNPADLFTKHLASREKVHQLLGFFGCEYRDGRAKAAPLLRPMGSDDRRGGHSVEGDKLPAYSAEIEAGLHDAERLPHLHSTAEIERLFPSIPAAPEQENLHDWDPSCVDELPHRDPSLTRVDELPRVSHDGVDCSIVSHRVATENPRTGARKDARSMGWRSLPSERSKASEQGRRR